MPYSNPAGKFVLHTMRILVLALLLSGYYLYLRDLVSVPFWTVAFLFGTFTAFFITPRFRFLPAWGIFILELLFMRVAVFLVFRVMGESADIYYFFFDLSFLPLLLPLVICWLFSYWSLRKPKFIKWEVILNGWLLFFLFYSQGRYDLDILPHPVFLAAGSAVFLFLEILVLVLAEPPGRRDRKALPLFIIILLLIISGGFIFFLGRYSKGAVSQGGGLVKPTLFRFDFSRYIKLESEITMSSDLVLLFREEEPSQQPLLRRFVLSGYREDSGFFMAEAPGEEPQLRTIPEERITLPDPGWKGRSDSYQEYFLVNFDPSSLVAMNYPVELTPLTNWDASSFIRNYKVTSRVSRFLTWELIDVDRSEDSGFPPMNNDTLAFYTDYGEDEEIFALSTEIIQGLENRYDRIMAIRNYLKENYYYSLKPGVSDDGNQLHHFLFESRKGYCSYFAFSMALMCRSLGIPARVAVGFFIDPELGVMNIYPVRADMAHAWVEILFPGYGWINFDPTSQELAPGEDFQFGGLEVDRFLALVEEILTNRDGLGEDEKSDMGKEDTGSWADRIKSTASKLLQYWYLVIPAVWILFILIGELWFRLKNFFCRTLYCRMEYEAELLSRRLIISDMEKRRSESLLEWSRRYDEEIPGFVQFMELFLKSRYGVRFSREDYSSARALRRDIARKLNRHLSWKTFLKYLIFPFRRMK